MPAYIGIDPGLSGGMAAILFNREEERTIIVASPMPRTRWALLDWVRGYSMPTARFVVEKVSGYVGKVDPGSSMFNFGAQYGHIEMALTSVGVEEPVVRFVGPKTWQAAMEIPEFDKVPGEPAPRRKTRWKNHLKAYAQQLFPQVEVVLATADALLLAEYCRRTS